MIKKPKYVRLLVAALLLMLTPLLTACPGVGVTPAVTSVTIVEGDQSIMVGQTATLTVTVAAVGGANPAVNWSSSDLAVATVDTNGLVTGVAVGTATITATSVFNPAVAGTVTVTVTPVPAVTSVTINEPNQSLLVGGTFPFTVTVAAVGGADESVTWSSDNEAFATVDANGLVTGVAVGTATITATSVFNSAVAGTVTVTVTAVPAVTSVTINEPNQSLLVGGTFPFTATVAAVGGADESVTWISSDLAVATVDANGLVTGVAVGTATITATSVFNSAVAGTVTVTVTAVPAVTSVTINEPNQSLLVGGTFPFTATVAAVGGADESVTWISSDLAVATVDTNGLVTGVAVGTATITATSVFNPAVAGTVTVTVTPVPAVTSVTIDQGAGAIAAGIPFALTATVAAVGGADVSLTWSSNNINVTVDSATGAVTGTVAGQLATITATSVFDNTRSDSVEVFVADVVVTNGDDSGPGSLRQVYEGAAAGSVIGFAAGVNEVVFTTVVFVPFHDAHLIINDVTISGLPRDRVVLSGDSTLPIVPVDPGNPTGRSRVLMTDGTVRLENLTITNGANIVHGAGIRNTGSLTLDNVTVENNVADFVGNRGFGGGIHNTNSGTLTITNSLIRNNQAGAGGGVANGAVGATLAERQGGVVTISNSDITGNAADFAAGGLYNSHPGVMTLTNVRVLSNTADTPNWNVGGGIFTGGEDTYTGPTRAQLVINGGLIDGNISGDFGGGIAVGRNGFLTINGPMTISNNTAREAPPAGGAIIIYSRDSSDWNYSITGGVLFDANIPDGQYRVFTGVGPFRVPSPEEMLPQQFYRR